MKLVDGQIQMEIVDERVRAEGESVAEASYVTDDLTICVGPTADGVRVTIEPSDPRAWDPPWE